MGVENAEDTATWKANISIPRRQQFLPLLEEAVALGEEDNISIMICVVSALLVPFKRRRQAASRVLFLANSGGRWRLALVLVLTVREDG
jgi:hypothetical protein